MAIGSNHVVQSCVARTGYTSGFIPELWSQEVLRAYKKNITMSHFTDSKVYITTSSNPRTWIDGS
jgi:hypothetical protein